MSNGHNQIDKLIMNNTLKDFLVEAAQDETFTAGRVSDPLTRLQNNQWKVSKTYSPSRVGINPQGMTSRQHLQANRPQNPLAHLRNPQALNINKILDSMNKTKPGTKYTPRIGGGTLGSALFLAPAIQELLYGVMGLEPSGLEDETWFNPEGSTYETAFPPGPSRIEPIKLK